MRLFFIVRVDNLCGSPRFIPLSDHMHLLTAGQSKSSDSQRRQPLALASGKSTERPLGGLCRVLLCMLVQAWPQAR